MSSTVVWMLGFEHGAAAAAFSSTANWLATLGQAAPARTGRAGVSPMGPCPGPGCDSASKVVRDDGSCAATLELLDPRLSDGLGTTEQWLRVAFASVDQARFARAILIGEVRKLSGFRAELMVALTAS
jgi:hypothetical protein